MFKTGVSDQTQSNLAALAKVDFVSNYYLAGGTATALHLGHRLSFDLDFFSQSQAKPETIKSRLSDLGQLEVFQNDEGTFNGSLNDIKLSFFLYDYPLLNPPESYQGIKIAHLFDIGCMKLDAVSSRGTRRDFVDLYFIAQKHPLGELLELFNKKYPDAPTAHILKSLVYFSDAEQDPPLTMLVPLDWPAVKTFFQSEVKRLAKDWGLVGE